jgi:hypothetical protein
MVRTVLRLLIVDGAVLVPFVKPVLVVFPPELPPPPQPVQVPETVRFLAATFVLELPIVFDAFTGMRFEPTCLRVGGTETWALAHEATIKPTSIAGSVYLRICFMVVI